MYFIGIDLGTSACKLLLVDEVGAIVNEVTHEYPLIFPHPGWSEQKPEDWWSAVVTGVPELLRGFLRQRADDRKALKELRHLAFRNAADVKHFL